MQKWAEEGYAVAQIAVNVTSSTDIKGPLNTAFVEFRRR